MPVDLSRFELTYKDNKIVAESSKIGEHVVFKITFSDNRVLFITRATNSEKKRFWTSVPEGNQEEAFDIGHLIEQYYRANQ